MTDMHAHSEIIDAVNHAGQHYHRLVLLVGRSGSGKTHLLREIGQSCGWPIINLNLVLSETMLELSNRKRALRVGRLMEKLIECEESSVILLDNVELLFEPLLKLDPLRMLQGIARNRIVVAAWNGWLVDGHLEYAEPEHPEYRRYLASDLMVVKLDGQSTDITKTVGDPGA